MSHRLLVADDDDANRRLLQAIFRGEGVAVEAVADGAAAIASVSALAPDAVLLDLQMPGLSGLETLQQLRAIAPEVPIIILTSHGDIDSAVAATRLGAHEFLTRPISNDELALRVRRALEHRQLRAEVQTLRERLDADGPLGKLLGSSQAMREMLVHLRQVADSRLTVVVLGETGTGKELVARAIHHLSARRRGPFVAIDCGAIPEQLLESELFGHEKGSFSGADHRQPGRFQLAQGGTLFLDEVGNLPMGLQAKLLRVLQEREVHPLGASAPVPLDVRFIAATNEALPGRVEAGRFRQDLYYRLAEVTLQVPPLRERGGDVVELARHFLEEANLELHRSVLGISPPALERLVGWRWPGNIRELRNVVRQATLLAQGPLLEVDRLGSVLRGAAATAPVDPVEAEPDSGGRSLKERSDAGRDAAERRAIVEALRSTGGNKSAAARLLLTDFKTLHLKMRKLGLDASPR